MRLSRSVSSLFLFFLWVTKRWVAESWRPAEYMMACEGPRRTEQRQFRWVYAPLLDSSMGVAVISRAFTLKLGVDMPEVFFSGYFFATRRPKEKRKRKKTAGWTEDEKQRWWEAHRSVLRRRNGMRYARRTRMDSFGGIGSYRIASLITRRSPRRVFTQTFSSFFLFFFPETSPFFHPTPPARSSQKREKKTPGVDVPSCAGLKSDGRGRTIADEPIRNRVTLTHL